MIKYYNNLIILKNYFFHYLPFLLLLLYIYLLLIIKLRLNVKLLAVYNYNELYVTLADHANYYAVDH